MILDFLVPCSLLLLLVILVVILISLLRSLSAQRNWYNSWRDLAARTGLTYKETVQGPTVGGMYAGRIISLFGTKGSGTNVLLTTNNRYNNHLMLKPSGAPASREASLEKLFTVECKSHEFKNQLLGSQGLSQRMAPLANQARARLTLSGEELSFTTPSLILNVQELIDTLDILCDFSKAIEGIRLD
jgi:hypothetical protein